MPILLLDEEAALAIKKGWARLVTLDDAVPGYYQPPVSVPRDSAAMASLEQVRATCHLYFPVQRGQSDMVCAAGFAC
jgi:hypothetical protein